jgi:hypothetical protein
MNRRLANLEAVINDPVAVGANLARVELQSPNYVPGVSGWQLTNSGGGEITTDVTIGAAGTIVTLGPLMPSSPIDGQFWFNSGTSSGNPVLEVYNAGTSSWNVYQFGTEAIAASTITAAMLIAGIVAAGIVDGTTIQAATFLGADFVIDSSGFFFYQGTPGSGNLLAAFAPGGSGVDQFGNAYSGGFEIGIPGAGQIFLLPNEQQPVNITTAISGIITAAALYTTNDVNETMASVLGSMVLGGSKMATVMTSPFGSGTGAGMILEAQNDSNTDEPIITFGQVSSPDGETIVFAPIMTITPYAMVLYQASSGDQVVVTYTTAGTHTLTPPAGVSSLGSVECWGPGGGGANGQNNNGNSGGAAGAGGEYSKELNVAVTPLTGYTATLGAGGAGGAGTSSGGAHNPGANGSASTTFVGNSITVTAHPGQGGSGATGGTPGSGSTNATHFSGGHGANHTGSGRGGAGAGSSAGTGAAGAAGLSNSGNSGGSAGVAPIGGTTGGNGGIGGSVGGPGGDAPNGAGGGGGGQDNTGFGFRGGNGGDGKVRITYSLGVPIVGWSINYGTSFTDQFGNTIPAGVDFNGLAITSPGGATWQMPMSQTDSSSNSASTTGLQNLTKIWSIPANDPSVNTAYRLTVGGTFGVGVGTTPILTFAISAFSQAVITFNIGGAEFLSNNTYWWRAQGEVIFTAVGSGGAYLGSLSVDIGSTVANQATVTASSQTAGGFAAYNFATSVNTTASGSITLQAKWSSAATSPNITGKYSILERLGP